MQEVKFLTESCLYISERDRPLHVQYYEFLFVCGLCAAISCCDWSFFFLSCSPISSIMS